MYIGVNMAMKVYKGCIKGVYYDGSVPFRVAAAARVVKRRERRRRVYGEDAIYCGYLKEYIDVQCELRCQVSVCVTFHVMSQCFLSVHSTSKYYAAYTECYNDSSSYRPIARRRVEP